MTRLDLAAAEVGAELAETLGDVVYALRLQPDMAFEYVSTAVVDFSGHTPEEHYADAQLGIASIDPRDLHIVEAAFEGEPGARFEFTVRWIRQDGATIWAQHRCRKKHRSDGSVVIYGAARDVTSKVEAEDALAASEERYRLLAENASDIVWRTNTDALVEWVSPSLETVTGWEPEALVGRHITDFAHPKDIDRVRNAGETANEGGRVTFEARYLCKDGSYRWLEVTARPLVDHSGAVIGRAGSCRDVHSEIEAWEAMERSESRFRLAMASAPTGMALVDLDRRFVEVNPALCRMLGHEAAWLIGRRMIDVVNAVDDAVDLRMRDELLSGETVSVNHEIRLVHADGAPVWVQHAIGLLRDEGGVPLSYVSQFVNVTEAREAREALHFMATHDPLTQLFNRRELLARMSRVLSHAPRAGSRLAVLFADLDGLKQVNDTYGHSAGDRVLIEAARRIDSLLRDDDLAARIGGDEFVVVLPAVTRMEDALAVARKIREVIAEPLKLDGHAVVVGVSIGVAVAAAGDDAPTVIRQADMALYRAKNAGRNSIEEFDEALDA
ncbi:MAG: PAS domain S-box protein [Actinobacteria bacterium]|nr:PAS domain S-box protein [Actinomycetota bacterium]